jgi:hypothetical protein
MLFAITYSPRGDVTEEGEKRLLQLFANWKPPAGYDIKNHFGYADGEGGLLIVEVTSVEALTEAAAPWGPFFRFESHAIADVTRTVPLLLRAYGWRDSVQ